MTNVPVALMARAVDEGVATSRSRANGCHQLGRAGARFHQQRTQCRRLGGSFGAGPEPDSFDLVLRGRRAQLRAEEHAIVQRMNNENTDVKSFFTRYEAANAIFDVEQIAACYAEVFMFGGPAGVQCVKKEDFLTVLPRRKEFFRSRGLVVLENRLSRGNCAGLEVHAGKSGLEYAFRRGAQAIRYIVKTPPRMYCLQRMIAFRLSSRSITRT